MKTTERVVSIIIISSAIISTASAAEQAAPSALAPVSVFTAKDIPEAEPGKPAWLTGEGYGVAYYDKWVYTVSKALYILQFERDATTAKLTYKGATPFGGDGDHNSRVAWLYCRILLKDGNATLVVRHGAEAEHLNWYSLDKNSGKPTLIERTEPKPKTYNQLNDMLFISSSYYRFGDDGVPFFDGKFQAKHRLDYHPPPPVYSPDGRNVYYIWYQNVTDPKNPVDPANDRPPQIETYDVDPKTHVSTYNSSMELPFLGKTKNHVYGTYGVFSPDGKHLYYLFCDGHIGGYYYVLARDPNSGALTIASKQATSSEVDGIGYGSYTGIDRLAFANNGRNLYFVTDQRGGPVGCFSRDPVSGAVTILPPVADMGARRLAVDPVNGNLFTVGDKIASFKIPGVTATSSAK